MPDGPVIAYLTSAYARASDSFIRGEVAQLRALGFTVHTFSVRVQTRMIGFVCRVGN